MNNNYTPDVNPFDSATIIKTATIIIVLNVFKQCTSCHVFIVKDTFAERNKTICNKTLNKCLTDVYFSYFVTLMINIESDILFVGYSYEIMNSFWLDRLSKMCSFAEDIVLSIFTDLKLERIISLPCLRI